MPDDDFWAADFAREAEREADEIASAASMVMGQAGEGLPVVLVRGLADTGPAQPAQALVRAPQEDLFR